MRPINFRAWHKEHKRMYPIASMYLPTGLLPLQLDLLGEQQGEIVLAEAKDVELMQFTGLLDRHGKEIYEGDIVTVDDHDRLEEHKPAYLVQWGHFTDCCVQGDTWILGEIWQPTLWYYANDPEDNRVEIIGNRYENSEFLPKST